MEGKIGFWCEGVGKVWEAALGFLEEQCEGAYRQRMLQLLYLEIRERSNPRSVPHRYYGAHVVFLIGYITWSFRPPTRGISIAMSPKRTTHKTRF